MKRVLILMFLLNISVVFGDNPELRPLNEKIRIGVDRLKERFFSQNTFMDNESCDCRSYFGKEFVDCMAYSEKPMLINVLNSMDAYSVRSYLRSMNYQDYEHFVKRLSEEEWQMMQKKLSLEDCKTFVKTRGEQIELLQNMYLKAVDEVVQGSGAEALLLACVLGSGLNPIVITGGLILSEIDDWDGKGCIGERLKSIEKRQMSFDEKKAFINKTIRDYYVGSQKVGLDGLPKLHHEIDAKVNSIFEVHKARFFS